MCQKFTPEQLNSMDHDTKNDVNFQMQERLDKLEHDYENLIEQVRLANQQRFVRHTEKREEMGVKLPVLTNPICDFLEFIRFSIDLSRKLTTSVKYYDII